MKFTLSWLKDHLDTKATVDEIATTLSAIGLEVEGIEDPAKALGAFTIARIVEAKKPGDELEVTLLRGGNEKTVTVTLGNRPASIE